MGGAFVQMQHAAGLGRRRPGCCQPGGCACLCIGWRLLPALANIKIKDDFQHDESVFDMHQPTEASISKALLQSHQVVQSQSAVKHTCHANWSRL